MRRGAVLAAGCALLLALTACKSSSESDGGGGAVSGGPPAGGWPQPVNGQLTTQMCGLLTNADYAKYGHQRLPLDSEKRADDAPNAIDCLYMTADELSLDLQPTSAGAELTFAASLKDHKQRLTEDGRPSVLARNVVSGADESWFDYWTLGSAGEKFTEYEIRVRRGSLLAGIVLSGIHGKNEKDPRTVLTGLAGLVLSRIPDVGRTDTGKLSEARFSVTGKGRARQIVYYDPATSKSVTLTNVKLPWHVDRPVVTSGRPFVLMNLTATGSGPMSPIGCAVSVDGTTLVEQTPRIGGTAFCMKNYTPPK
jgi:hypothetical protein